MKSLELGLFKTRMDTCDNASRENDLQAWADLFTQDARYYESPFDQPRVGHDDIFQYWSTGAHHLQDKEFWYDSLAIRDHLGVARWRSPFIVTKSGKRFALACVLWSSSTTMECVRPFASDGISRKASRPENQNEHSGIQRR